ncbi:MAG: ketol-acid reductoisomerase [Planctomycetes bacterium]|nr:ketol-acid reductoisomerase [Planctomycetota bacterium]
MKTFTIGGVEETVIERTDVPPSELKKVLSKETVAVIGYGTQGRGQALNLRDNGVRTIVAVRPGKSFELAKSDGWVPGKTLFSDIAEAVRKATVVEYLLSDAGQKANWATIRANLQEGAALYFSHGFSIVFRDQTGVVPPANVDVILVAPKGSGTTVRRLFLEGRGINASFAVEQDYTGRARERAVALGIAIGAGYLFETSFRNEVLSDLTGERGVLMGAIYGLMRAQYQILRKMGHTPSEAFNETVEEATQSLYPLIGENGMDWMYANCSTTAQRGALDWCKKFEEAAIPVFDELYEEVRSGRETARVLEANSRPDYHQQLQKELAEVRGDEIWQIGAIVRNLRPERLPSGKKAAAKATAKSSRNGKASHRKVVKAKLKPKKKAKARR